MRSTLLQALLGGTLASLLTAQSVTTYHNDADRSGANLHETTLATANVTATQFGRLFTLPVDGDVYAQPLYVAQLAIPNQGVHNVLFVATAHDSVYAFDADIAGPPLWVDGLGTPVPYTLLRSQDIAPVVGITGTPAIDLNAGLIYVVTKTWENGAVVQRLHALGLASGAEQLGGPVVIGASSTGSGAGGRAGTVTFDPLLQNQRAGLLLSQGTLYITWAGHGDMGPYHGWVLAYNAATLALVGALNLTPDGWAGGVWQAGAAPAADAAGNVYVASGNGTEDAETGGPDHGDSVLRLSLDAQGLHVADWFSPANQALLLHWDLDLGSGGVMLLPDQASASPHLLLVAGKIGTVYLLNRDGLGGFHALDSGAVQSLPKALLGNYGGAAYWNDRVYFMGTNWTSTTAHPVAFSLVNGLLSRQPVDQAMDAMAFPGASPSISADGNENGILWLLDNSHFRSLGPAILEAFDAANLTHTLYRSDGQAARDTAGGAVKFTIPTVVAGKVYVGGHRQVTVYGLLAPPSPALVLISGANQNGAPGALLPQGLVFEVRDGQGAAQAGVTVQFSDSAAGGTLSPPLAVSDAAGQVTTQYRLPPLGGTFTVTATATLPAGGTLTAAATVAAVAPAGASQLVRLSGYFRTAAVGQPTPPLVVRALDALGNPVPGAAVRFGDYGAGGQFTPAATLPTLVDGSASVTYTPFKAGHATLFASLAGSAGGAATTWFDVSAIPAGLLLQRVSPYNPQVSSTTPVPVALSVAVTDAQGRPLPGQSVYFTDWYAASDFSASSGVTDAQGRVTVRYQPPLTLGTHWVKAWSGILTPLYFAVSVVP